MSTSSEAADSIKDDAPLLRRMITTCRYGDATCDEVEVALGLRHQTCSARFTELKTGRHIVNSGLRRETRSGRRAEVYVVRAYVPRMEGMPHPDDRPDRVLEGLKGRYGV